MGPLPKATIFFRDYLVGKLAVQLSVEALKDSGTIVSREEVTEKFNADMKATYNTAAAQSQDKYNSAYVNGTGVIERAIRKGGEDHPELVQYIRTVGDAEVRSAVEDGAWSSLFFLFDEFIEKEALTLCTAVRTLNKCDSRNKRRKISKH